MLYTVYLVDRLPDLGAVVVDCFTTDAADRADALAEARELGWPASRTRARSVR